MSRVIPIEVTLKDAEIISAVKEVIAEKPHVATELFADVYNRNPHVELCNLLAVADRLKTSGDHLDPLPEEKPVLP